ncbi:hypothetical protein ACTFIZ_009367 [Dictyostelium cf. discoideum]
MTKKIDKNSFIQRYLEKTNCSNWKLDENNHDKENFIGLPSLEFLYEIQKSISFKLANKYKYISTNNYEKKYKDNDDDDDDNDDDDDDDDDDEENDDDDESEEEEENNDTTDEEPEKRKRKKVSKSKTHSKSNIRSTNSGLLKMNCKNSINRFPLSQPCLKPEIYNERCGPEVLMSLGILYQQILISQIKSLNSFQK